MPTFLVLSSAFLHKALNEVGFGIKFAKRVPALNFVIECAHILFW